MTHHRVRITGIHQLLIDDELQEIPEGVDHQQAAHHFLYLAAAGAGAPVLAHVVDERSGASFELKVNPDGSTQPPGAPPSPTTPEHAEDRFAQRIAAAQQAGRARDFATAVAAADDILRELTAEDGDTAPTTLKAAQFRADLAYLSGDSAYATASWTWIALAWFDRLGPGKRLTQQAASRAAASWIQLNATDAARLAPELLDMLLEVAAPERTATIRGQVQQRLQELTSRNL
ncbi:hypothetical protein ABZW18_00375 [Streptomyces sp. NPDC004647]|uniref:hypothetical protein n=1 Tax=Streptomyces sp. NPDC004647 TaxID=3154671 RepID=UPI0033B2509E